MGRPPNHRFNACGACSPDDTSDGTNDPEERFFYRRYPEGFGQTTPHEYQLYHDDPTWPIGGFHNFKHNKHWPLFRGMPIAGSSFWSMGARVYTNGGFQWGINPNTTVGRRLWYRFYDYCDNGKLYYFTVAPRYPGGPARYRWFSRDSAGNVEQVFAFTSFNGAARYQTNPYLLGDIRGGKAVVSCLQDYVSLAIRGETTLQYFDLATGELVWERNIAEAIAASGTSAKVMIGDTFRIGCVRIGDDGFVYVSFANSPGELDPAPQIDPCFAKLDPANGDCVAWYARWIGFDSNDNWYSLAEMSSSAGSFDVDVNGNVYLAVRSRTDLAMNNLYYPDGRPVFYAKWHLAKLNPQTTPAYVDTVAAPEADPTPETPGDYPMNPNGYQAYGFTEEWIFSFDHSNGGSGQMNEVCADGGGGAYFLGSVGGPKGTPFPGTNDYGSGIFNVHGGTLSWYRSWYPIPPQPAFPGREFYSRPQFMRRGPDGKIHTAGSGVLYPASDFPDSSSSSSSP